jgi:glycosyltransferase involved in cell wall biosynthesis
MIGGGLTVAHDIIELLADSPDTELLLISPKIKKFTKLPGKVKKSHPSPLLLRPYFRWFLDFVWLPQIIKEYKPDLIISLTNLPARSTFKQVMFNDNAFVSQKNLLELKLNQKEYVKNYLRRILFWKRLKYLDLLVVQTQTEKKRLEAFNKKIPPIKVLAPLLPSHLYSGNDSGINLPERPDGAIRIACISYFWPHKNIEVLKSVLERAEEEQYPIQLILTINENHKPGKRFINKLSFYIKKGVVINLGNISAKNVPGVIEQSDGVILPSLLESYSLNYLEAWGSGKPLLVSRKDFAKEACMEAAVYFDPMNSDSIFSSIKTTFGDAGKIEGLYKKGKEIISAWNVNNEYLRLFRKLLIK